MRMDTKLGTSGLLVLSGMLVGLAGCSGSPDEADQGSTGQVEQTLPLNTDGMGCNVTIGGVILDGELVSISGGDACQVVVHWTDGRNTLEKVRCGNPAANCDPTPLI